MKEVHIIVINMNGRNFLGPCLTSLCKQTYENIKITIFDNASTDKSLKFLKEFYPCVEIIASPINIGFSGANNYVIRKSLSPYLLLLNPDTRLEPDFVKHLVRAIESNKKNGSSTGLLHRMTLDGDPLPEIDSAGHYMQRGRFSINHPPGTKDVQNRTVSQQQIVFGAPGCASLYRREMLEDIRYNKEYFDEDFFAYFEDIDLDWRANRRNWQCHFTPLARGLHFRHGSGARKSHRSRVLVFSNNIFLVIKNDSIINLLQDIRPFSLRILFLTKGDKIIVSLKAIFRIIRLFPKMAKKRWKIRLNGRIAESQLHSWFRGADFSVSWFKKNRSSPKNCIKLFYSIFVTLLILVITMLAMTITDLIFFLKMKLWQ
jgi:GT2 family glycosyltransferase